EEVGGKDDVLVGRAYQPGVVDDLLLQLAGPPAGAAERHQVVVRPGAAADVGEYVTRGGDAQALGHLDGGAPQPVGIVQDEALVGFHRAARQHGLVGGVGAAVVDVELFEDLRQRHLHGI